MPSPTDPTVMSSSPSIQQDPNMREGSPPFSFDVLPLECRQQILSFYNYKNAIILHIIERHIPRELLPYDVMCSHARNIQPWTRAKVHDILELYFNRRLVDSFQWTIGAALALVKFHESVTFFTNDYIDSALEAINHLFCSRNERERWISGGIPYARPSPSEFSPREKFEIFFSKHAPWEMEQIGAVNEYLYWKISAAFNNIAAHDVELGYYTVYFSDTETWEAVMGSQHKRGFLLKGLPALHRFVTRANHHSRIGLISIRNSRCSNWLLVNDLIYMQKFRMQSLEPVFYRDLTAEQIAEVVGESFAVDSDSGPQQASEWAHLDTRCFRLICAEEHRDLRRFGYVMWDQQRLQQWGAVGAPFQAPQQVDENEVGRRWVSMWPSIQQRQKMYEHGARGWRNGQDGEGIRWVHGAKLPETQRRLLQ
ncbi:hypothetical protein CNMCM5793_000502 [Aspergillus hiratsukae]|uniref:Uncharacterized protein n=1 Tax=Aspergillus hiratsukae TaxID=1194566 RepID=A0A8H6PA21_9EURO|nr:hypothetical protein CNMCM5793_000502 [Aspergillus hiratsukae]KAF7156953.1 hypothetical protein CNMCM6106_001732 [Aspergillus hiratsukae]